MRKSKTEAAATRESIVHAASREFKRKGISETGLADIMGSAGLTHGGFYRHFNSKEELLHEALQQGLDQLCEGLTAKGKSQTQKSALESVVGGYLSQHRRDDFETACPVAALASDLHRADRRTKTIASEGVDRLITIIQKFVDEMPSRAARARATGILATMVGGMVLSRLAESSVTSNRILENARDFSLRC